MLLEIAAPNSSAQRLLSRVTVSAILAEPLAFELSALVTLDARHDACLELYPPFAVV